MQKDKRRFLENGIQLAKTNDNKAMEMRGLILLASLYLSHSNADSAKKLFGRSRKLLASLENHPDYDDLMTLIFELEAQTYQLAGKYEKAFRCWFDFLEAADSCQSHEFLIARVYLGLGACIRLASIQPAF